MVEQASNNKLTSVNGQGTEKKEGFFAKITKQLDRDMKEGRKEEAAGLKIGSNSNKKANGKKSEPAKLSASKEKKQLPAATSKEKKQLSAATKQESKQLSAAKAPSKKTTTKQTSIKSKKTKTNKSVTYTGVTNDGRPAWVRAMDNTKKQEEAVEAVEVKTDNTFAGQYLMPTHSNFRRNPGPSLNMYKDMARQVKFPRIGKIVKKG